MKLHTSGNTLSEYSFLFGLIALAAIGGLMLFGNAISDLLNQTASGSGRSSIDHYLSSVLGGGAQGNSGNNGSNSGNSNTFGFTEASSSGTNATSVDGTTGEAQVVASLTEAQKLEALADAEPNPELKKVLRDLAENAYWIGGSQAAYEYHHNGNLALSALSAAISNKKSRDDEFAARALISIRDNENFLQQNLNTLLSLPDASAETKALAQTIVSQVLDQSQAKYESAYQAIPAEDIPTEGLRTSETEDPATGEKAIDLVIGEGDQLLEAHKADKTPAVKTSLEGGQTTTNYAQTL